MRFGHPLYRQRLYEMQTPTDQRLFHGRVIEISEQGALELSAAELATHHTRSRPPGVNVQAVEHCRAAAVGAERLLAYESAARFWEMALECVERSDSPARADLLKRQGWALWAGNSWQRGEEVWSQAIDVYETIGETAEVAELALAIGDMMRWRQHLEPSEEWIRRALPDLPENSSSRARALSLLGSIQCLRGESEEGLKTLQEAVKVTGTGNSDARIDFWLSYGLRRAGDRATAKTVAERGLHEAEAADDTHGTIMLSAALARTELIELRLDAAEPYLTRLERHADRADTAALLVLLQTRALRMGYVGDWERLADLCNATKAQLRLAGGYQLASVNVFWAEAQSAQGNWRGAMRALKDALPALGEMQDLCRVHIARILAASGAGRQALDDVRTYLDLALQPGVARSGVTVMADAAAAIDEASLWEPAYELVLKEEGHLTFVYTPTSIDRVRGRLAARLKRWDDAASHFESAIEHLSTGGAVWELLRTYQDYAVMRRARGRRGDATKADALDIKAERTAQERLVAVPQSGEPYVVASSANVYGLTGREVEVLQLVAAGLRNKEVADKLSLSPHTVERHLENIYNKMDVRGRAEAVTQAAEAGVLTS
jgi:ATP/maltotriose-dependent transcriptional regulator MalT